jgi:hypothetical protein
MTGDKVVYALLKLSIEDHSSPVKLNEKVEIRGRYIVIIQYGAGYAGLGRY